jgi:hypothetical protein
VATKSEQIGSASIILRVMNRASSLFLLSQADEKRQIDMAAIVTTSSAPTLDASASDCNAFPNEATACRRHHP